MVQGGSVKLTKFEHACFTVEKDGKMLIVDPGAWTTDLGSPENVVAIVVTHNHQDHFDRNALGALIAHNPDAIIYAPKDVTEQVGPALPNKSVTPGEMIDAAPFSLEFFGGEHAVIHPDMPRPMNVGVLIDEKLYYPGDSFVTPGKPVEVLALPVTAPWLKMQESFDFLTKVKPRLVFPTHDAIASEAGKQLPDRMVPVFAEKIGATYQRLVEPIDI